MDSVGSPVVAVVRPTEADRDWARLQGGQGARVQEATYSLAELDTHMETVRDVGQRLKLDLMTQVNVQEGTVEIHAAALPSEALAEIRETVPEGALTMVERSDYEMQAAHASPQNWNAIVPHYEGGLAIKEGCTTAFYVANGFGPFGTSAGHCHALNSDISSPDGSFKDRVRSNTYNGSTTNDSDAIAFSTATIYNYPRVMELGPCCNHKDVTSRWSAPNPQVGQPNICRTGVASNNTRCGTINFANGFKTDSLGHSVRLWCINTSGTRGDSGGPVYSLNIGGTTVHAAGLVQSIGTIGGQSSTCFTHIYYVLRDLNVSLVYPTY